MSLMSIAELQYSLDCLIFGFKMFQMSIDIKMLEDRKGREIKTTYSSIWPSDPLIILRESKFTNLPNVRSIKT